jgi:potassium-transporting ATPase KdpC subunit
MLRQLRPAIVGLLFFTLLTGVAYPLAITGLAQLGFRHRAEGSTITVDGEVVGSELLAQPFEGPEWFQPRPSAVGYDSTSSGGSNLGPTNPALVMTIARRADDYRGRNHLDAAVAVPIDAVTASGSGLDPHISPRNARLQAPRVAASRGLPLETVLQLVEANSEGRTVNVLGEPRVNVVRLNVDLAELVAR